MEKNRSEIIEHLYIIGNGFDLHHGLKTAYKNFRQFCIVDDEKDFIESLEYYPHLINGFELINGKKEAYLWQNFEEDLADIDRDEITEHCSNYLVGYGAEEWKDAYHHDYQYEMDVIIERTREYLEKNFSRWIIAVKLPNMKKKTNTAGKMFLSFNYTRTLEECHGVPDSKILHIHGVVGGEGHLIFGHSFNYKASYDEDTDVRVAEGEEILSNFFTATRKPVAEIIEKNKDFFQSLNNVTKVTVIGHSLGVVDMPYFSEIKKSITKDATWEFSCRKGDDMAEKRVKAEKITKEPKFINISKLMSSFI